MRPTSNYYVLATGNEAAHRLGVLHQVHGPDTEAFLIRAGLKPGMRVADVGCGVGIVSRWIARQVGDSGSVTGIDISSQQIDEASRTAKRERISNISFLTLNRRPSIM